MPLASFNGFVIIQNNTLLKLPFESVESSNGFVIIQNNTLLKPIYRYLSLYN